MRDKRRKKERIYTRVWQQQQRCVSEHTSLRQSAATLSIDYFSPLPTAQAATLKEPRPRTFTYIYTYII